MRGHGWIGAVDDFRRDHDGPGGAGGPGGPDCSVDPALTLPPAAIMVGRWQFDRGPSDVATMEDMGENAESACRLLKALANKDRLTILCNLAEGELCVSDLEEILQIRQPTLSQQLARLRHDDLVETRRDGKVIKRFIPTVKPDAPEVIEAIETQLKKKS